VPALSVGLFAAPAGHDDTQTPHDVDEVYVVVAGRAVLDVDGSRSPVEAGSVAYVPRTSRTGSSTSPRTSA
jgi:mannose-6-phosphate isomerase-like protein (cupin superfamily)